MKTGEPGERKGEDFQEEKRGWRGCQGFISTKGILSEIGSQKKTWEEERGAEMMKGETKEAWDSNPTSSLCKNKNEAFRGFSFTQLVADKSYPLMYELQETFV